MRTYDITLTLSPDLPIWPGDDPVSLVRVKKLEDGDASNVSLLTTSVHAGTHVDAPSHFLQDGPTVDQIPIKTLTGRAYVVHLPDTDLITKSVLEEANIPPRTRRVLFRTRNSEYWSRDDNTFQEDYVALTPDAAAYLIKRGVKLVGIDYLSIAPFHDTVPTHEVFLKAGVVILEGIDLSEVSPGRYTLYCLPLKLAASDGAPARAILVGV